MASSVQLGVGLPHLPIGLRDPRPHHQHPLLEIHMLPPQRTQLTPPRTGGHGHPDQRPQVRMLPRLTQDLGRFRRAGWLRLRGRL
jgi:hypothetical protein